MLSRLSALVLLHLAVFLAYAWACAVVHAQAPVLAPGPPAGQSRTTLRPRPRVYQLGQRVTQRLTATPYSTLTPPTYSGYYAYLGDESTVVAGPQTHAGVPWWQVQYMTGHYPGMTVWVREDTLAATPYTPPVLPVMPAVATPPRPGTVHAALAALEPNQALDLGAYACGGRSDDPYCMAITDYSGLVYNPVHHQLLLWGGGHAGSQRDDIDVFDLQTLTWQSAYQATPCATLSHTNFDSGRGAWLSTGHPIARHTYDLLVMTPDRLLNLIAGTNIKGSCYAPPEGISEYQGGAVTQYDPTTRQWSFDAGPLPPWSSSHAAAYDPPSGYAVVVGGDGIWTYDPAVRTWAKRVTLNLTLPGSQNLVYYPPTQTHYYVVSTGAVWEVRLNRQEWGKSTVVQVPVTGDLPSAAETGWAYDSASQVIGGGVKGGVFAAYDPATQTWTTNTMQPQGATQIGTTAFHALAFDPVNEVFLFLADGPGGKHTWAYRYGPPGPPPTDIAVGELAHDGPPTPEQLSLVLPVTGPLPQTATATVRYRPVGASAWTTGHPLYRIQPSRSEAPMLGAIADAFAWPLIDLSPGTAYEVEVTVTSGAASVVKTGTFTTRALPPPTGPATVQIAAGATNSQIQGVLNAAMPGDVIEFAPGTYHVSNLQVSRSGTASQPVTIRGASRDETILDAGTGRAFYLVAVSYVTFEHFTLQGSGVDSGTNAYSAGIVSWSGATTEDVYVGLTVRELTMRGVDVAVTCPALPAGCTSAAIYHNTFLGNNTWTSALIDTNATWNDDGVNIAGSGNVVFENTIQGFGDCISYAQHSGGQELTRSLGNHAWRNDLRNCGDDLTEADYATRNSTFYDNRGHNSMTAFSLDPLYGGPFVYARNIVINTGRTPFKWNSPQSGQFVYNNTIVRTTGAYQSGGSPAAESGWYQANNGPQEAYGYQNNLLVYRGVGGFTIRLDNSGHSLVDFTHNAWYPDSHFQWPEGNYVNLSTALAALPASTPVFGTSTHRHDHDVITGSNPWTEQVTLGPTYLTEVTATYTPTLLATSNAAHSGAVIPGITDGSSGAAPDRGAVIAGRPLVRYGDPGSIPQPPPDTTPPPAPVVTATVLGLTSGQLAWPAVSDPSGITRYEAQCNSTSWPVEPPTATQVQRQDLVPGTDYACTVMATDGAGNTSAASAVVHLVLPALPPAPTYTQTVCWVVGTAPEVCTEVQLTRGQAVHLQVSPEVVPTATVTILQTR